jgi:hypothetical protein
MRIPAARLHPVRGQRLRSCVATKTYGTISRRDARAAPHLRPKKLRSHAEKAVGFISFTPPASFCT